LIRKFSPVSPALPVSSSVGKSKSVATIALRKLRPRSVEVATTTASRSSGPSQSTVAQTDVSYAM
jgi:hypothetical protein